MLTGRMSYHEVPSIRQMVEYVSLDMRAGSL
jgi:hypothetical protein